MADRLNRLARLQKEREQLNQIIRRLRKALAYYADPNDGWAEIEHADAYEASRELVPHDDDERAAEAAKRG